MKQNIYQKRIKEWEQKYGKLSPVVQAKINKLILEFNKTQQINKENKALQVTTGTKIVREYNGKQYSVEIVNGGYEYNNKTYKSLSAIANLITGKHWNGKRFFGVA